MSGRKKSGKRKRISPRAKRKSSERYYELRSADGKRRLVESSSSTQEPAQQTTPPTLFVETTEATQEVTKETSEEELATLADSIG